MSRLGRLEARRQALIGRCATERAEIARLLGQLRPLPSKDGDPEPGAARFARHPLAALAVLGGLALLGRTREVLSLLIFIRTAVSIARRAGELLRRIGRSRAARAP